MKITSLNPKKYKHIKTGDIVEQFQDTDNYHIKGSITIHKRFVENSNDWQEIIDTPKEYEILCYYDKANNCYYKLDSQLKDRWCKVDGRMPFFNESELNLCSIHSIKRLSDGEVFTIGDKINGFDLGRVTDLMLIKFIGNKLFIGLRDLGMYPLSVITKAKQPLFKTADGVDIFKGDTVYSIWYDNGKVLKVFKTEDCDKYFKHHGLLNYRYKSNMEQFCIRNSSILTLNDVIRCFDLSYDDVKLNPLITTIISHLKPKFN